MIKKQKQLAHAEMTKQCIECLESFLFILKIMTEWICVMHVLSLLKSASNARQKYEHCFNIGSREIKGKHNVHAHSLSKKVLDSWIFVAK